MEIFISYSRQDGGRVREVVSALGRDGFNVWIDREGITGGNDFVERIVSALNDCKVVVFFSSEASNASPWTRQEISLAQEYNRPIIPVRLDLQFERGDWFIDDFYEIDHEYDWKKDMKEYVK